MTTVGCIQAYRPSTVTSVLTLYQRIVTLYLRGNAVILCTTSTGALQCVPHCVWCTGVLGLVPPLTRPWDCGGGGILHRLHRTALLGALHSTPPVHRTALPGALHCTPRHPRSRHVSPVGEGGGKGGGRGDRSVIATLLIFFYYFYTIIPFKYPQSQHSKQSAIGTLVSVAKGASRSILVRTNTWCRPIANCRYHVLSYILPWLISLHLIQKLTSL